MRTTVRLDETLLAEVKVEAARTGRTMTALIEEALRESLARRRRAVTATHVELPVFTGRGLQPGVDLDDTADLLDVLDGARGPA